jgi:hypothetical protein
MHYTGLGKLASHYLANSWIPVQYQ